MCECGCGQEQTNKQIIKVGGMSCAHCQAAVEKAVQALPGILTAKVDLASGTLTVEMSGSTEAILAEVKAVIDEIGFEVED